MYIAARLNQIGWQAGKKAREHCPGQHGEAAPRDEQALRQTRTTRTQGYLQACQIAAWRYTYTRTGTGRSARAQRACTAAARWQVVRRWERARPHAAAPGDFASATEELHGIARAKVISACSGSHCSAAMPVARPRSAFLPMASAVLELGPLRGWVRPAAGCGSRGLHVRDIVTQRTGHRPRPPHAMPAITDLRSP